MWWLDFAGSAAIWPVIVHDSPLVLLGGKSTSHEQVNTPAHPSEHTLQLWYRRTHTLWPPLHSRPEFSNTSTFLRVASVKQKHKSITHLGWSGREGCCQLRPFFNHGAKTASVSLLHCLSYYAHLLKKKMWSVKQKNSHVLQFSSAHAYVFECV